MEGEGTLQEDADMGRGAGEGDGRGPGEARAACAAGSRPYRDGAQRVEEDTGTAAG